MEEKPKQQRASRKYDESFIDRVVELGGQGFSLAQIAKELDVSRQRLYIWATDTDRFPGFGEALNKAREFSEAHWERVLQDGIQGKIKGFNQVAMIFMMKSRFKDWQEVQTKKVEITKKIEDMTDQELDEHLHSLKALGKVHTPKVLDGEVEE